MSQVVEASGAPAAIGPYSHGFDTGGIVFTSGQLGLDPETGKLVGDDIASQAEQAFKNIGAILEAAGLTYSHVVKTTCFITDLSNFSVVNEAYKKYFPENAPARSCIEVSALPAGGLVEIEAIAAR